MKCTVETIGPCRKKLNIEIPAAEADQEYQSALAVYVKAARLPGFRPGRAPQAMVQRRYAKELQAEVQERLVARGYREAIQESKQDVVEVLDVTEAKYLAGQPLMFSVTLDVPPEFTLPNYQGIPLTQPKVEVAEDEVAQTLRGLLERQARFEDVAGRPVQKGDLVQVDYAGVCAGQPVDQLAPKAAGVGRMQGYWMLAEEDQALLPGLGTSLIGMAIGDQKDVAVAFPADYSVPELAGRQAAYHVTAKAIRERKVAASCEGLFKAFGVESEEQLRARVRADLLRIKEQAEQRRRRDEAVSFLLSHTTMDVPESVVQQVTEGNVYEMVSYNTRRGVPRGEIETHKDEIFQQAKRTAVEDVRLRYLLHRIADAEALEVSADDLEAEIRRLAAENRTEPRQVRATLEKQGRLAAMRDALRRDKALDFVLARATITATAGETAQ
ncbi:MAG: trigger factor [Kiritimatiellaeota bacterium]|nr:trigger factor [Kiritimatiellota bacterium]